ncbi:MAG TPA: metallophosphoesterase [Telluria sp.]|nr:metallophosphoesterase [Telluria sp.]
MKRLLAVLLFLLSAAADAGSARHMVFVSDLHVGAGRTADGSWNRIEDFRWQDDFDRFLDQVSARTQDRTDLVLAGDVFELWQSPTMRCSTDLAAPGCVILDCNDADTEIGCSEADAAARLEAVLARHPEFVSALRRFAARGDNRVVIVPGNHDGALTFPGVRRALLARLDSPRITVAAAGYWLSPDGVVYADHGHQFDDVNQFPRWPEPFVERGGQRFLAKPWGENMVQRFYNQYEAIFPVVDNLADEKAGVRYAVRQAGFPNSAAAVGRFLRFFIYEESLRQAVTALGKDGKVQWDYAALRGRPATFFLDVLPADLRPVGATLETAALSDVELDALCAAKENLTGAQRCPRRSDTLGAAAKGFVLSDDQRVAAYLRRTLPKVAPPNGQLAAVYVFGHTHSARRPRLLDLGEVGHGTAQVTTVNTGAFQRVATAAQIEAVVSRPGGPVRRPLDLTPEDLPACYTAVWIAPYAERAAVPRLYRWSSSGADFALAEGSCLD